jgi:hypothetical protein
MHIKCVMAGNAAGDGVPTRFLSVGRGVRSAAKTLTEIKNGFDSPR